MKNIVYFLGAGATKAIAENAPLNMNLVKKAINDFSESSEAKNLIEFVKRIYHRQDPVIDNQIWNLLDYIIQQNKSPSFEYNLEQINNLKTDLMKIVVQEFDTSFEKVNNTPNQEFIAKIQSQKPTIISTNYDILIDNALLDVVKKYNYGTKIRKTLSRQEHDSSEITGLKRPTDDSYGHFYNVNSGEISLLKLHGSLNWIYCPKCNEVDLTLFSKGANRILKGLHCDNPYCTAKYKNLLITPTMYKNYENRIIKETWECAEQKLKEANEIVFVGYALKEEDYQIRCLLMKALLSRSNRYDKIIIVEWDGAEENYLNDIQKKYKDLYEEIDFRPIGFKKYIENINA